MTPDRIAACRRERADVLAFCRDLDTAEWQRDSAARGWRVQDVLAHMGSGCRVLFGPAALKVMRSNDIERTNDDFVDVRREWPAVPNVARHADIWHNFESLSEFRRKNELLKDLAADAERKETLIERATGWTNRTDADDFHAEGVTLFTTEIHPTSDGYDFAELKTMIAGRDQNS